VIYSNLGPAYTGIHLYAFVVLNIPMHLRLSFLIEILLTALEAYETPRQTSYEYNHFEQPERQHKPDNIIAYKKWS
jgi:hypothetical protein